MVSQIFQLSYMDAVKEVYEMDKFDVHKRRLDGELKGVPAIATIKQYVSWCLHLGLLCRFVWPPNCDFLLSKRNMQHIANI